MLVAILSQNSSVLVFVGYRTIIARYVAKWGIAQMRLSETKYQGRVSHHFGGVPTSLEKYRAIWGIAAIVSQYLFWKGHGDTTADAGSDLNRPSPHGDSDLAAAAPPCERNALGVSK